MNKLRSIEVKLIAAFLLVTGLLGFVTLLFRIAALDNLFESLVYLIGAVIFGVAAYSGLLLLQEKEKGLEIARGIVAIQILNFNIAGLGYSFVTGAFLFVGIANARLGFDFGLDTRLAITLADDSSNFVLQANLLAIVAFIYLSRLLKRVEDASDILDRTEYEMKEEVSSGPPKNK